MTQVKTEGKEGYTAMQVSLGPRCMCEITAICLRQLGICDKKEKKVNKPLKHHFAAAGVQPKRILQEFRVTEDALLEPGTEIFAAHFVPGQKVDVVGTS